MPFEIGEFAKRLSGVQIEHREQIEYIDIDRIDDDPRNFYELSGLDELAANIELLGLQQPIRVRDGDGDHVVIVSGHRRRAAIRKLVQDGRNDLREVPCIREAQADSPAMQELKLIYANSSTRELTTAEKAKQIERTELLLYQLQEEGVEFPGRMRDHVAEVCKVSGAKVARLKVIQAKLIPEWAVLFQADKLPEQTAYAIARMPEDLQRRLKKVCPSPPVGYAAERILSLWESGTTWEPDMTCPDGRPCKRGDAFLRHDVEHSCDVCKGQKCCMECKEAKSEYYACDRMCSKAQALRKEKRDERAEAAEDEKAKRQVKIKQEIQASAARLLQAADAAGLDDSVIIPFGSYRPEISVQQLRAYAAGDFGDRYFYGNDLSSSDFDLIAKISRCLKCSSDYILGLSDNLGGWHWWPEAPKKSGFYWVVTGPLHGGGSLYWWNQNQGYWEASEFALDVNISPVLWMECPELPEAMAWVREPV